MWAEGNGLRVPLCRGMRYCAKHCHATPRFLSNDVERNLGDAGIDHSKRFGGSQGEVDDTAVDKWSTVIDPDSYTLSIHEVCHAQMRAERQRGMCRAKSTPIEPFTARGVLVVRIEAGKSGHRASRLGEHFIYNARTAFPVRRLAITSVCFPLLFRRKLFAGSLEVH